MFKWKENEKASFTRIVLRFDAFIDYRYDLHILFSKIN